TVDGGVILPPGRFSATSRGGKIPRFPPVFRGAGPVRPAPSLAEAAPYVIQRTTSVRNSGGFGIGAGCMTKPGHEGTLCQPAGGRGSARHPPFLAPPPAEPLPAGTDPRTAGARGPLRGVACRGCRSSRSGRNCSDTVRPEVAGLGRTAAGEAEE